MELSEKEVGNSPLEKKMVQQTTRQSTEQVSRFLDGFQQTAIHNGVRFDSAGAQSFVKEQLSASDSVIPPTLQTVFDSVGNEGFSSNSG